MKEAEKLRTGGSTTYDKIISEAHRLNDTVQNLFWYEPIPTTDRKKLIKEGFELSDGDGFIKISW